MNVEKIQSALDQRRTIGRHLATKRQEEDHLIVDAGIHDRAADGSPIRMHVANEDVQRGPYERLRDTPRPGHADYPARVRYGPEADLSGGGIFSGRMTVGLVIGGAIAAQMLAVKGIEVASFTQSIGGVPAQTEEGLDVDTLRQRRDLNEVGSPDPQAAAAMEEAITKARKEGDSLGGIVETRIFGRSGRARRTVLRLHRKRHRAPRVLGAGGKRDRVRGGIPGRGHARQRAQRRVCLGRNRVVTRSNNARGHSRRSRERHADRLPSRG